MVTLGSIRNCLHNPARSDPADFAIKSGTIFYTADPDHIHASHARSAFWTYGVLMRSSLLEAEQRGGWYSKSIDIRPVCLEVVRMLTFYGAIAQVKDLTIPCYNGMLGFRTQMRKEVYGMYSCCLSCHLV